MKIHILSIEDGKVRVNGEEGAIPTKGNVILFSDTSMQAWENRLSSLGVFSSEARKLIGQDGKPICFLDGKRVFVSSSSWSNPRTVEDCLKLVSKYGVLTASQLAKKLISHELGRGSVPAQFRPLLISSLTPGPMVHCRTWSEHAMVIDRRRAFLESLRNTHVPILSTLRVVRPSIARIREEPWGVARALVSVPGFRNGKVVDPKYGREGVPPLFSRINGMAAWLPGLQFVTASFEHLRAAVETGGARIIRVFEMCVANTIPGGPLARKYDELPALVRKAVYTRLWGALARRPAVWAPIGSNETTEESIFSHPGHMYRPDVSAAIVGSHLAHMVRILAEIPPERIMGCHIDSIHIDVSGYDPWPMLERRWQSWKIEAEGKCAFLGTGNYCYWDEDGKKVKSASENRSGILPGDSLNASLLFRDWSPIPDSEEYPKRLRGRPGFSYAMPYYADCEDYPLEWPKGGWPGLRRWSINDYR